MTIALPSVTVERLRVPISTTADPTATAPDWAVVPAGAMPAAEDWVAGSWSGTYTAAGWVDAISPLIGGAAADIGPLTRGRYDVWVRFAADGGTPARKLDPLTIN